MIRKCLAFNEADRPTYEQLLAHPWVFGDSTSPNNDGSGSFERSKPVSVSVPKNLVVGGVNPHQLRHALLDETNQNVPEDVTMVEETAVVGSPMDGEDIFVVPSTSQSSGTSSDDVNMSPSSAASGIFQSKASPSLFPIGPLVNTCGRPVSPLRPMPQYFTHLAKAGLGSACSSAYSSACSSYINESGLCSSL